MPIEPASLDALRALALGAALSGLLASAFRCATGRAVGLGLLRTGDWRAYASVPLLVFALPFVVVRALVTGGRHPFASVLLGTVFAGLWSLLCGRLALDVAALL